MPDIHRMACARLALALTAGACAAPVLAAAPMASFSTDDVFRLEWAGDPQISPDGHTIVYERWFLDVKSDTRRSNLWTVAVTARDQRPLTTGSRNDTSPRWSPDGTRIAYASADADGSPQIFVRWLDSGATLRVAQLTAAPRNLAWSADGRQVAFTMAVPMKDKPLDVELPEPPAGADWAQPPHVIDRVVYRADGQGFLPDAWMQVFVVPATGGAARQLTDGTVNHGDIAWMPDGKSLLVSANRHKERDLEPLDNEIYSIPLDGGAITALTTRYGPDLEPAPSPDGRLIAFTGFDDRHQGYQVTRLYVMDRDGSNVRALTGDFDRDVGRPRWMRDGRGVVVAYADHGEGHLALVTLDGRRRELAAGGSGADIGRPYEGFSFSLAGDGTVAYMNDDATRPADVATVDRRGTVKRLTALNDDLLAYRDIATVSAFEFSSAADGRSIQGWVMLPPGFDAAHKYPLILEIHGGPFAAYGPHFSAEMQLYAARGYVVVYVNPRGSTSYGEEFGNLIHHAYPGQDYDDLMSAVDAVIARGYIDSERLYVTGGSGGGVLTAWIVGRTDRFRAAVSVKPVINWTSFALTSDNPNFFYKYWFSGFPWEQPEEYWKRSPLSQVGNVTTPTMLMTGEEDHRTPISEAEQFYEGLRLRKVDTLLVRVPGASHHIATRPSQLIAKSLYILAWFAKYGGPPAATP
jgi:dipeptidyl aminopeptidase/acylaminoacyl peptidase